jgi:hypothetical protein
VVLTVTAGKEVWAEFFTLRLWRCFGHPWHNHQFYGNMEPQLDSACQKGPEAILVVALIVGCNVLVLLGIVAMPKMKSVMPKMKSTGAESREVLRLTQS